MRRCAGARLHRRGFLSMARPAFPCIIRRGNAALGNVAMGHFLCGKGDAVLPAGIARPGRVFAGARWLR